MSSSLRRCSIALFSTLLLTVAIVTPATAAAFSSSAALTWLGNQQQNDGGFELGGYGGAFETPDAALAIAEQANAGANWNTAIAFNAVNAQTKSSFSALNYLENFVKSSASTSTLTTSKAGEISVLASALGLDPIKFDPNGNGAFDLLSQVRNAKNNDGSYGQPGAFSATLFSVLALRSSSNGVGCSSRTYIFGTQQANGGFNFAGDRTLTGVDIDTTGRTLNALAAMGVSADDPQVIKALKFLADHQQADGGFLGDFENESNASSTALADLGLRALGIDTSSSTWRNNADPALAANTYIAPEAFLQSKQAIDGHIASEYDTYGVNTVTTSQTLQALSHSFIPGLTGVTPQTCIPDSNVLGNEIQNNHNNSRYRFVHSDGKVEQCVKGSDCSTIFVLPKLNAPIVAAALTSSGNGFWLFGADGGVFASGDATFFGSATEWPLQAPIVGAKAMPNDSGYVLFARDGGVFNFGSSRFYGSANPLHISNVVGGALTADGKGYDLFGKDGGVFSFGNAQFHGSLANTHLQHPIVGGEIAHNSNGYLMFGSDGGVFSMGNIAFHGSAANLSLNAAVVSGSISDSDNGYVLAGADGGTFAFGDAPFVASAAPNTGDIQALIIG